MKPSAGWPLTKPITAGIDWIPIWPGIAGCSSMFILTSLTLPLAARTAFSRIGVSCRQGPHQGAQKSISTGWRFDSSMTSFTKVWVVVSLIRSGTGCGAGPLPCSIIVTVSSPDVLRSGLESCPEIAPVLAWTGPKFSSARWRLGAQNSIGPGRGRAILQPDQRLGGLIQRARRIDREADRGVRQEVRIAGRYQGIWPGGPHSGGRGTD